MNPEIFWRLTSVFSFVLFIFSLFISVYNRAGMMMRLYCILMFVIDASSQILAMKKIHNLFLFYIMLWVEIPILILLFCAETPNLKGKELKLITALYVLMAVVFYFFESFENMGTYSRFVESIFLLVLAIIYFNNELKNPKVENIMTNPGFWFISAFIIYYGGTLFVSLFYRYVMDEVKFTTKLWVIHNVFDLIKGIFIFYGLVCYRKVVKSSYL